eukprot:gene32326-40960_t
MEKDGECLVGSDAEWEEPGGEAVEVPSFEVERAQPETGPEDSGAAGGECEDAEANAVAATDVVESQGGMATATETGQLGVEDDALQSPREDMCLQPADGTGEETAPSSGRNARAQRRAPHQAERDAERRQGVKRRLEGCPALLANYVRAVFAKKLLGKFSGARAEVDAARAYDRKSREDAAARGVPPYTNFESEDTEAMGSARVEAARQREE